MRRLRTWIHKHRQTELTNTSQPPVPPLPSLPAWREIETASSASPTQPDAALFQLPPELRHRILLEAFGDGTVHMDLRFRPPLHTFQTSGGREPSHGGYPPLLTGWGTRPPQEPEPRSSECAWRWYSCRCHRNQPGYDSPPCRDGCLSGEAHCPGRPFTGFVPDKCFLGVVGFLLSCKQAYVFFLCATRLRGEN